MSEVEKSPEVVAKNTYSFKDYPRLILQNVSVEPLLFLYALGFAVSQNISQVLYMNKICRVSPRGMQQNKCSKVVGFFRLEVVFLAMDLLGMKQSVILLTTKNMKTYKSMFKRLGKYCVENPFKI